MHRTVLSFVIITSNCVQVQESGKVAVKETGSSAIKLFICGLFIACVKWVCIPAEHVIMPGVK